MNANAAKPSKSFSTALTIGVIVGAATTCAANDNAGLAWRLADAEPYTDDARQGVEVGASRIAEQVATMAAPLVNDALWRVDASRQSRGRKNVVMVWPRDAWSRAVSRRVRTMLAFARAAGLEAFMWGW